MDAFYACAYPARRIFYRFSCNAVAASRVAARRFVFSLTPIKRRSNSQRACIRVRVDRAARHITTTSSPRKVVFCS
jgi:hypothetical protein